MKPLLCFLLAAAITFAETAPVPGVLPAPIKKIAEPFIGMTEAQVRQKYGKPVREENVSPAEKALCFEKNGIILKAFLVNGRADCVGYWRKDLRAFHRQEAEALLQNNHPAWVFDHQMEAGLRRRGLDPDEHWMSSDRTLIATNYVGGDNRFLCIRKVGFAEGRFARDADALRGL